MPYRLLIFVGVVAGLVGGVAAGHFLAPAPIPPSPALAPVARAPVVLPPGWDPRLLDRLNRLENQLAQVQAENPPPVEARSGDDEARETARQRERLDGYQKELDYKREALDAHAREPVDGDWAQTQSTGMATSLAGVVGDGGHVKEVDCRSKTCTATLSFPSPGEALAAVATHAGGKMAVPGCRGFVAIPTPPSDAGPYDFSIIYNCR